MEKKGRTGFVAVIVGGSVAGLTLALTFEKAGIEYVLLERRDVVAPATGSSIMIFPNGATILDQLGVYENMGPILSSIKYSQTITAPGKANAENATLGLIEARYVLYQV
jgi:2-polyprenyl-6-methoxyphenol hydroxylase-like FAD-dependent oxidoreductase